MVIGSATATNTPVVSQYSGPGEVASNNPNRIYSPEDINSIHRATEIKSDEVATKNPRILNTAMHYLSQLGRWGTGLIEGIGGVFTLLSLFLFNAKVALVCALPTLAAIAGFIKLKPKDEMLGNIKTDYLDLLKLTASDEENAKPQFILSRATEIIKALQNTANHWRRLKSEGQTTLHKTLHKLRAKIMPILEEYKILATRGKDGVAQMFPGCSLTKLQTMIELINETLPSIEYKISKTASDLAA